jgi:hypothetical protein
MLSKKQAIRDRPRTSVVVGGALLRGSSDEQILSEADRVALRVSHFCEYRYKLQVVECSGL